MDTFGDTNRKITKLSVFDFDGTLVSTELPETGKPKWLEAKGEKWPHKGWWGRAESLDLDLFENAVIDHVVEAYKAEKNDESNLVCMLTGRLSMLSADVEKILDKHELVFDRKYYNTGGDTITVKQRRIESLLKEFPTIKTIEAWEDRESHVEKFTEWGKKLCDDGIIDTFIVNHVVPVEGDRHS